MKVLDRKPQVGIFEVVDGVWLTETEDTSEVSHAGDFFDGDLIHRHDTAIKTLVKYNDHISKETKDKFAYNRDEYLKYPRGRVDYNTRTKQYHIMGSQKFLTEDNVERITRLFHLPPLASGNIVLEYDEGHYGIKE